MKGDAEDSLYTQFSRLDSYRFMRQGINAISRFFDRRIGPHSSEEPITIGRDDMGNTVIESTTHTELTAAGREPAQMVISPDGAELIRLNPGLLRNIYSGHLPIAPVNYGGGESNIYIIPLKVKDERRQGMLREKTFVVKYIYPREDDDRITHGSGIVGMRLLQKMQRESPVKGVQVALPWFATHDMWVAPFVHDSIHSLEVFHTIEYERGKTIDNVVEDLVAPEHAKNIFRSFLGEEWNAQRTITGTHFEDLFFSVMEQCNATVASWLDEQPSIDPIVRRYHSDFDFDLPTQSVISVRELYRAMRAYYDRTLPIKQVRSILKHAITIIEPGSEGAILR